MRDSSLRQRAAQLGGLARAGDGQQNRAPNQPPLLRFFHEGAVARGAVVERGGREIHAARRRGGRDADGSRAVIALENRRGFHRRPRQPAHGAVARHERANGGHAARRRSSARRRPFLRLQRLVQPVHVPVGIERPAVQRVHERDALFVRHVILVHLVNHAGAEGLDDLEGGVRAPDAAQRLIPSALGQAQRRRRDGFDREEKVAL